VTATAVTALVAKREQAQRTGAVPIGADVVELSDAIGSGSPA